MKQRVFPRGARRLAFIAIAGATIASLPPSASAYILAKSVVSGGETATNGGSFVLGGTVAEAAAIGRTGGGSFRLIHGFWQPSFQVPTHVSGPPAETITYVNGLLHSAPNPFREGTTISYTVAEPSPVRLVVYDVTGRKVRTLVDDVRNAGRHAATWDGRDGVGGATASGVYYFQLDIGTWSTTRKMLRLR